MAAITDAELAALPPQRPMALSMFRDRHRPSTSMGDPLSKMNDELMRRVLPRTWFALARRQERLLHDTPTNSQRD